MGARNLAGRTLVQTGKAPESSRAKRRRRAAAMVPARCFPGIPGFAKGVISRWGGTITFVDDRPFFM